MKLPIAVLALSLALPPTTTATGTCTCHHEPGALHTYLLDPCRFLDTRDGSGGPPLLGGELRLYRIQGKCGIPVGAKGVLLNIIIARADGFGHLTFWAAGKPMPLTSTINFQPGITLANAQMLTIAAVSNATQPDLAVSAYIQDSPPANVDLVVDVLGYLK